MSYRDLSDEWEISKSAISQWAHSRVRERTLSWCDEDGNKFQDANELKKAKSTGKAFLGLNEAYAPVKTIGLPTPHDLTKDAAWKEGGDLWVKYDLELEDRKSVKVHSGVKEVLSEGLNTPEEEEPIEIIEKCEDEDEGVKVLSEIPDEDEKPFETDAPNKGNGGIELFEGILTL